MLVSLHKLIAFAYDVSMAFVHIYLHVVDVDLVVNSVTYWCQDPRFVVGPVGKQTNKRIAYGLGFRFRASA